MKVLIVDDEPLARQRLSQMVAAQADCSVVGTAQTGEEALAKIDQLGPDLVLLDIRMPGMDGISTARQLLDHPHAPLLVFCSAYDDHALTAFEVNATDYLVKPVRLERLRQALDKALKLLGSHAAQGDAGPCLQARVRGEIRLIPVAEVHYLLADAKYVEVHCADYSVLIEESLVSLEDRYGERFVRVHRNCLVALDQLAGLRRNDDGSALVRLRSGVGLEVSRRNLAAVRRVLKSR